MQICSFHRTFCIVREGKGAHRWAEGGGGTSHARTTYCCAFTVTCCPSGSSVVTTFRKGTGGFPTAVTGFPAAMSVLVGFHQRWMRAPSAAPTAQPSARPSPLAPTLIYRQDQQAQKLRLPCWSVHSGALSSEAYSGTAGDSDRLQHVWQQYTYAEGSEVIEHSLTECFTSASAISAVATIKCLVLADCSPG